MNAPAPTVSVIIPTYQRPVLLRQLLDSVRAQTFRDFEVIVAEDGATELTASVVASCGMPVTHLPLPHSGLVARVRNAAVRSARGRLIAFCDDDDLWEPAKLERQLEALGSDPGAGFVCSNALYLSDDPALDGTPVLRKVPRGADRAAGLAQLLHGNFVICSSVMIERTLALEAGLFPEDPRLRYAQDYALWLCAASLKPFRYLQEPLLRYRQNAGLTSRTDYPDHRHQLQLVEQHLRRALAERALPYDPRPLAGQLARRDRAHARDLQARGQLSASLVWWLRSRGVRLRAEWLKLVGP